MARNKKARNAGQYRVESKVYNIGPVSLDEWEYRVRLVHQVCETVVDSWDSSDLKGTSNGHLTRSIATAEVNAIKDAVAKGRRGDFFPNHFCSKCGQRKEIEYAETKR